MAPLTLRLSLLVLASLAFSSSGYAADSELPAESKPDPKVAAKAETKVDPRKESREKYESLELFQKVMHFVRTNYVDEVKEKDLIEGAIKGMLDTLDPHSNFLNAELFKDMKADTAGRFGGIGLEIGMKDEQITVVAPMEDTPAWKAGVKAGDKILRINGDSTKGLSLAEAVAKMRGKLGADVKITIQRANEKPQELKMKRETIKVVTVRSDTIEPGYGYVRLAQFNEDASRDMRKALDQLEKKEGLKGLIFDLRNNPGGLLDQAVDVTSLFIDEGVVVSTKGRDSKVEDVRHAKKGLARKQLPLVVLVNGGSASASEIVAGALQDNKRALIAGQTTFGKGSVQTVVDLGTDLGLKLTIARYYTPSGRSIQELGVQPDIVLEDYDTETLAKARKAQENFRERDLKRHMVNPLNAGKEAAKSDEGRDGPGTEPQRFNAKDDYQVRQAVNYLKGFDFYRKLGKPQSE